MRADSGGRFPNFFIIGAAKSGTTALFEILAQHPAVFGPVIKETRFFSLDERFEKGLDWYLETYFRGSAAYAVRFEATPAYLTWSQKVAPRLKAVPTGQPLKFSAIFRDPVKRAYSHYWHRVRLGTEAPRRVSFEEAIHSEEKRLREHWQRLERDGDGLYGYYRAGCYASLLQPYLDLFPPESFHFLLQSDLAADFGPSLSGLLRFLEISPEAALRPVTSNEAALPRSQAGLKLFDQLKQSRHKGFLKSVLPAGLRKWFRQTALMKPFEYPPMPDPIRRELYERYADEIKRLEVITGRDLSHWSYQPDSA